MEASYDLAIIGGGVNGCGIARDAAGRGLRVFLCEQNDLASGTSSAATKLIHGGLRYLEQYEFRLVREALREREVLWGIAPHIIWPLRFVLPYHRGLRPAWMLRLGLFLYDHLGGRKRLPPTRTLDLRRDTAGQPLKPGEYTKGFEYSDCWVEDARLVALNARDAADRGATVLTRTKAVSAKRGPDRWSLTLLDRATGLTRTIAAKVVVNAAGPWAGEVLNTTLRVDTHAKVRLVQGSHIVVTQALRPRSLLHLPERRRPHLLRDSVRAGFHADRDDGPRLRGRPRRRARLVRGDRLHRRLRERLLRAHGRERRHRLDLFGRASAVRQRRGRAPRPRRGITFFPLRPTTRARHCSLCSAAS